MERKKLKHPFFVIIGPSGSGKTKVAEAVFPTAYKVISHTTRPIRKEEKNGVDYYFESSKQFDHLVNTNAFVEHDRYHGYQYGVGVRELVKKTTEHYAYDVLTIKGFQKIEKLFGLMVIPIFLDVSKKNVLSRLQNREENDEVIKQRAALYDQESQNKNEVIHYPNHSIVDANQPFEKVVQDVKQIVNTFVKTS